MTLTFRSTGFSKQAGNEYLLTGMTRAGFELSGKLNRKEFGLHWSALKEISPNLQLAGATAVDPLEYE
ncbi:MAG: YceI family protein [Bacteroidota bacterium]